MYEEKGDPELLYWIYDRLNSNSLIHDRQSWTSLSPQEIDQETLDFLDKEYEAALQMGDEVFIRRSEVNRIWLTRRLDLPVDSSLNQLLNLRAYFEQDYSNTITFLGILESLSKYYSKAGEYERALYFGKLSLNLAKSWQDLFWIGITAYTVAQVNIDSGVKDLAAGSLLDAIDWHLAIGQVWQTLGCIWVVADYFWFLIGSELAVSVLSMIYRHQEAIPYYRQGIAEARPQFEKEMGAAAFAAAWETGKLLDFEAAVAQLRAALGAGQEHGIKPTAI
jgi:tetratricopeptide (TPR) repeat protein